ncbi:hypothetical protein Pmani_016118 [Petrolisthes manimaculis]|uniref:Uncharacterized protein n=1 Tax=Petrolisthes manimaculis TaxID=1843537 RepID=A0AAE1PPT7_9EUCA|nr:hypothetical protein Pmani_016118 [Petrolisthes manimaculis]
MTVGRAWVAGRGGGRVSWAPVRLTLPAPSHHHQALAYIGATGISAPLINAWDGVRVCNPALSHTKIINNHIWRLEKPLAAALSFTFVFMCLLSLSQHPH